MDAKTIKQRFGSLQSDRTTVQQTWQWIERFIVPYRGKFFRPETSEHEVEWRYRLIYDSTAVEACQILANSVQGGMLPQSFRWFGYVFRNRDMNKNQEGVEWLQECGHRVWMALNESNFNLEAGETLLDLSSFGTSAIVEESEGEGADFKGLDFKSIPIKECYFEEDHKGQVLRFYRLLKWRPLQVLDKFGDATPDHIREKADAPNTDERVEIIFCIYERKNYRDPYSGKPLAPERRPYGYKYVLFNSGEQIGKEGGYYEMPAFLPRWQKVSGSVWGHSPAHLCLSTVLSLNQAWELFFAAWEKGIDPTQLTDQRNLYGDFDHGAGKVNTVRDINKIRELVPSTRMDMTAFGMENLKQQIRDAFHVNQLELKDSPAMTATEVMARMDLMNRLLGPTMGRLQNDMLDPLLQRAFRILWRNGQLPEAPADVRGQELDIEYQGPLARSTKIDEIAAADQYVANLVAMSTQAPQAMRALDNVDWDAYARGMAEMRQVPMDFLRSQEEVDKQRQQEAAMAGARDGIIAAGEAGQAAKAVGEGNKAMQEAAGNVTPISR